MKRALLLVAAAFFGIAVLVTGATSGPPRGLTGAPVGRQMTVTVHGPPGEWWPGSNEACGDCMPAEKALKSGLQLWFQDITPPHTTTLSKPVPPGQPQETIVFTNMGVNMNVESRSCGPTAPECILQLKDGPHDVVDSISNLKLGPVPSDTKMSLQYLDGIYFQGQVSCPGCLKGPAVVKITTAGDHPNPVADTSLIKCPLGECADNPIGWGTYSVMTPNIHPRDSCKGRWLVATLWEEGTAADSVYFKAPCAPNAHGDTVWTASLTEVPDLTAVDVAPPPPTTGPEPAA